MKDTKELIGRAIILLLISDRCALEKEVIGGRKYSLEERERQRKKIYRWLIENDYNLYTSAEEMRMFERSVSVSPEISQLQVVHEALEPILWSLGLIKTLSSYDSYVITDFHSVIEIGSSHTTKNIMDKVKLLTEKEIKNQRDVSLLWNWRARMGNNKLFLEKDAKNIIINTFGHEFQDALKEMNFTKESPHDFKVNSRPFNELKENKLLPMRELAMWRHHAFEWILSSDEYVGLISVRWE